MRKHLPRATHAIFMKIAEPRAIRVIQFGVYLGLAYAGFWAHIDPPEGFERIVGYGLVTIFANFILMGGFVGAISVLPGIWWLERIALISLLTGMAIYGVLGLYLGSPGLGIGVPVALTLTFIQRWTEIRKFQLAPREE